MVSKAIPIVPTTAATNIHRLIEVRYALAVAANAFEKSIYEIQAPSTLEGIIELKLYERKL